MDQTFENLVAPNTLFIHLSFRISLSISMEPIGISIFLKIIIQFVSCIAKGLKNNHYNLGRGERNYY